MKRLNNEQVTVLHEILMHSINPKDVMIQLILETGCRVGESLLIGPIDLDSDRLNIPPLKSSDQRSVIITKNLRHKLHALSTNRLYVHSSCETRNKASQRRALCRHFKSHCQHLFNAQYMNIHMLRHTAGLRLYHQTKDLLLVKDWMGHKSIGSTMKYMIEDRKGEANAAMSLILEGSP